MRVFASLFAATCFALVSGTLAHAQSAGEMLRACEILQRGMHIEGEMVYLPPGEDVHQCWGFMSAVQEYSTLADQDGKTLLDACPNPDTTTVQIIHVFINYANAHPEKLGLKAAAVAYNAMADAFPCK
jgi:hypothetical protein